MQMETSTDRNSPVGAVFVSGLALSATESPRLCLDSNVDGDEHRYPMRVVFVSGLAL